jgi:hypothetical protein
MARSDEHTLQSVFARSVSPVPDKRCQGQEGTDKDDSAALLFRSHSLAGDLSLDQIQHLT